MRKIQKGLRFDLWPRAYSRFVRALLPGMLIVNATSVTTTSFSTNNVPTIHPTSNSTDKNQTITTNTTTTLITDPLVLSLVLPASTAVAEADQLAPLPGSVEELHLAYSLSRRQQLQQQMKPKNSSSATITSHNTVFNANQNAYPSSSSNHHVPLNRSPSIKKVTFCDESGTSCSDL